MTSIRRAQEGVYWAVSLSCVLFAVMLAGCSHTTFYDRGQPIVKTQANIRGFDYKTPTLAIHVDEINHSTPTLAGGKAIGGAATAFGSAATGLATALIVK